MARAKIESLEINGNEGDYEVTITLQGRSKPKKFELWHWRHFDLEPNEETPYICVRECEELYLSDMVESDMYEQINMSINNGTHLSYYSKHLKGQEL